MEDNAKTRNFREYKVWTDAVDFSTYIYQVTDKMPWFEKKGLCDQLQRAAVSISSNIAEGSARPSSVDFAHFLDVSLGSAYEVETQLLIARNIGYISQEIYDEIYRRIQDIERQLTGFIRMVRG